MSDSGLRGGDVEDVVNPDVEVIDAHMHIWDDKKPRLPDYMIPEFRADTESGHRIVDSVYVECGWAIRPDGPEHLRSVGETEAVAVAADTEGAPALSGIISFTDLTSPELGEALDAHDQAARGRFRGIRHSTAWDEDPAVPRPKEQPAPELMDSDPFRAGLKLVGDRGYLFEAFVYHPQISKLASATRAVPETTVVLEHLGSPAAVGRHAGRPDEVFAEWRAGIDEFSELPNTYLKIGGLGWPPMAGTLAGRDTPVSSAEIADHWAPFVSYALSAFGAQRCIAESNFPMDRGVASYRTLWNAIKLLLADLPATDQHMVLGGTARKLYTL
ncbi:amidohydrolase family protein [Arthrobacter sp. B6]|uniref:amidohydrolase family protein n=1 Tax=Arthrobacter sp. B6 TaxID=1570137 RepID=UPI00083498A4|nr:amidohydrolase family protein [Arthrobacter sp. B6]